jgi:hypothetical protein
MTRNPTSRFARAAAAMMLAFGAATAGAVPIAWTDWTTSSGAGGFTAQGTITTATTTVNVTYNNPQGIAFFQNGAPAEEDYWTNGLFSNTRDPATSPYTSSFVDNIPTGTDIVALRFIGNQTLTFSEAIANPVFSYVSLNVNGYAFNRDFEILSFGNPSDGNDCGYWGCGTSTKEIHDLGGGNIEYWLVGTGEPHGTIRFTGAFSSVTWRSLNSENWNGFTVGVQGTAAEVFVPEPGVLALLGLGLAGIGVTRRKKA